MKRRDFLKGAAIGSMATASNLNALEMVSNSVLNDNDLKMSASHFGAFYARQRNERFESITEFEGDFYPNPMIQGIVARNYDKTRIKNPCVRKSFLEHGYKSDRSLRGKEEFVEVSWDEALDLVANELKRVYKEYGKDAVYGGNFGWHCVGIVNNPETLLKRMLNTIGGFTDKTLSYSRHALRGISPSLSEDESSAKQTSLEHVLNHSEVIVFWGGDPLNTNQASRLVPDHKSYIYMQKIKKKGIKTIVIDPIYNNTATYFNSEHIAINPNTDVALMLGIIHYLLSNNLHNQEFLDRYTHGFDEFREYVFGKTHDKIEKTPLWASKITSIDENTIINLAKTFSQNKTMLMSGWSTQRGYNGEQAVWMFITLASVLGQIGTKGGGYGFCYGYSDGGVPSSIKTTSPNIKKMSAISAFDGEWKERKNIQIPVSRIVECLENPGKEIPFKFGKITYPDLRLCYWAGGNPFVHHQDTNRMIKAWEKFETFIVNECFWTATAKMADIVLPATTEQERDDITVSFTNKFIYALQKVSEPYANSRDDYYIFAEILKRFGNDKYEAFTENRSSTEWIKFLYEDSVKKAAKDGIELPKFDEFWKKGYLEFEVTEKAKEFIKLGDFIDDPVKNPLKTETGKIQIKLDSLSNLGYENCYDIPTWFEPKEYLGNVSKYPLNIISPHPKYRLHSQLNNTWLRDLEEVKEREPIWINPKDAKARNIQNGDIVRVFNDRGEILAGAIVTELIKESVVKMQEGAWLDMQDGICVHGNVNVLISNDETSEFAQGNVSSALVEIEKFEGELPRIKAFDRPEIISKS
ncbi:MAG: molybdopterin-dependent oxidoreductase [Campylobacteraceae bacterium]|nr:molybdopterin-dependent oxidoreductase [Campylobacteraceae bacterium]